MNRITTLDSLVPLRPAWRAGGRTLVFTNGVFDLLHLGHVRYLFLYLLWGVAGNLAQVVFMPDSRVPLIGASGAIAGVLGSYLVMYPALGLYLLFGVDLLTPAVVLSEALMLIVIGMGLRNLSHAMNRPAA